MKTQSDSKQEEFISRNGKLYYNFNQVQKTVTEEDGSERTFWEADTIEVSSKAEAKGLARAYTLSTTTVSSGITFYTDAESMVDLFSADRKAERLGLGDDFSREWKTANGWQFVTLGDIREAIDLRLDNKGNLIGEGSE